MKNTLNSYHDIIPDINGIILDIAKDLDVTLTDINLRDTGNQHLTKLDEAAFPPYIPA